ncbi:60S ribosomal protein L27B [Saxophila tyrrhenica]|uniref:60S ribosomal protein L27B n=1 Tax=Saxophila tyrrhenica TaxID=1690608 RepID=A0AAV9P8X8_9PEZI|nr:60S ribosomal protein L27B [Saxophila tyrrhenica]
MPSPPELLKCDQLQDNVNRPATPQHEEHSKYEVYATLTTFRNGIADNSTVLKVGRVAIISRGRYAGKKVVIIQPQDNGTKKHPFPHALVAGIERYPLQVTRRMSKARQTKRSKVKPFIKAINYNHLMPTRYTLELEGLKGVVSNDTFSEVSQREDAKKKVKQTLEERYLSGKNRWFFTPLREYLDARLAASEETNEDCRVLKHDRDTRERDLSRTALRRLN